MSERYKRLAAISLEKMVEYLRYIQKEDGDIKAYITLNELLQQGIIKMELYVQLYRVIAFPNAKVEITIE